MSSHPSTGTRVDVAKQVEISSQDSTRLTTRQFGGTASNNSFGVSWFAIAPEARTRSRREDMVAGAIVAATTM